MTLGFCLIELCQEMTLPSSTDPRVEGVHLLQGQTSQVTLRVSHQVPQVTDACLTCPPSCSRS